MAPLTARTGVARLAQLSGRAAASGYSALLGGAIGSGRTMARPASWIDGFPALRAMAPDP